MPENLAPLGPRTLDQHRAEFAWKCVNTVNGLGEKRLEEYRDLVRKLSSMVQTNGLGQAIAFLKVQKDEGKTYLYQHLAKWLTTFPEGWQNTPSLQMIWPIYSQGDLQIQVATQDSRTLRRATLEVQALVVWLKRFAEALEIEAKARKATLSRAASAPTAPPYSNAEGDIPNATS